MSQIIETFEPFFSPLLKPFAVGDYSNYCRAYKIRNKSYPAPTLNGKKAAYWIGTPTSPEQSIPIIAVSIPIQRLCVDFGKSWSIGAASTVEIIERANEIEHQETSVNPIGAAVLEFASSGPYTHIDALALVVKLCPLPRS